MRVVWCRLFVVRRCVRFVVCCLLVDVVRCCLLFAGCCYIMFGVGLVCCSLFVAVRFRCSLFCVVYYVVVVVV